MNKLVAMLRVKDGILFINEWLNVMEKLADEIVVVDNGSTDGTLEVMQKNPKVVDIQKTEGFDEGRDKILVYAMARKRNPDWCIWLDVDEIFEKRLTREILNKYMDSKIYKKYKFRIYDFLGDNERFFLYYKNFFHCFTFHRTLWKEQSTGYFVNTKIHNGGIKGIKGFTKNTNFRMKHLGYVNKEYVVKKTNNYISVDPERKELYLKHYVKPSGIALKWYEFDEKPFIVTLQVFLYNTYYFLFFPFMIVKNKLKRLLK